MTPVNGSTGTHTIAELTWKNAESQYPSAEINHPPGGAINSPPTLRLAQILPITSIDSPSVDIDPADQSTGSRYRTGPNARWHARPGLIWRTEAGRQSLEQ